MGNREDAEDCDPETPRGLKLGAEEGRIGEDGQSVANMVDKDDLEGSEVEGG